MTDGQQYTSKRLIRFEINFMEESKEYKAIAHCYFNAQQHNRCQRSDEIDGQPR